MKDKVREKVALAITERKQVEDSVPEPEPELERETESESETKPEPELEPATEIETETENESETEPNAQRKKPTVIKRKKAISKKRAPKMPPSKLKTRLDVKQRAEWVRLFGAAKDWRR